MPKAKKRDFDEEEKATDSIRAINKRVRKKLETSELKSPDLSKYTQIKVDSKTIIFKK